MTRDLFSEVALYLAGRPDGARYKDIAAAIHARPAEVRDVLLRNRQTFSGPRVVRVDGRVRHHYALAIFDAATTREPLGTALGAS